MKRMDVHFHVIAPDAEAILSDLGINQVDGMPVPKWNEAEALAFMDRNRIHVAVLSTSDFPIRSTRGRVPKLKQKR